MKCKFWLGALVAGILSFATSAEASGRSERDLASVDKAIGSTNRDLTFTPVPACRIVDTRVAGGPIAASGSRSFLAAAVNAGANFSSQGGSNTNCGVASIGASAVLLNVSTVLPAASGQATVYKSGESLPASATLSYVAGSVTSTPVTVQIPNPLAITDFVVHTTAQSDFVIDIMGYYAAPQATSLQCTQTALQSFNIAAGAVTFFNNPLCPTGYIESMPYCYTSDAGVISQGSGVNSNTAGLSTFCAWHNSTGGSRTVFGGSICCRVPGQ